MKTIYTLADKNGNTTRFTVDAAADVCQIEDFARDGRSMGWPFTTNVHGGRCEYRKHVSKFGMKLVNA